MAAVDYFLKLEGIEGESQDNKHAKEIQVESWHFGATQSGSAGYGTGAGAGKVSFQDFHFTTKANKASPKLMLMCANGKHIPTGVLVCRKAGGEQQEYLKITFSDLLVSSYQIGGSEADVVPLDQCSLNYSKIEYSYQAQKKDGTLDGAVKMNYDVKKATGN